MLSRRHLLHGAVATTALATLGNPGRARAADSAREAMARAATAFLGSLDEGTRRRAQFPFSDAERRNWHYVPRSRKGVAFKEMSGQARTAAHELMKAALSGVGYAKAVNVIALEEILRQIESSDLRDPERYYFSVFGTPAETAPWGWRVEGHHLSLNLTLAPGRAVSVTPAFFGANPATVRSGPRSGLRTLREEQDLGLALARAVDPSVHRRLILGTESLGDIVSGPGRGEDLRTPAGVPLGELDGQARELATRLVEVYARNMRTEVADEELRKIRDAGLERVHFAWAGPIDPGRPHYYRLHGPTVLIEYDNTQNGANHIHSVWHDPSNDFGADPLRAHYDRRHRHG